MAIINDIVTELRNIKTSITTALSNKGITSSGQWENFGSEINSIKAANNNKTITVQKSGNIPQYVTLNVEYNGKREYYENNNVISLDDMLPRITCTARANSLEYIPGEISPSQILASDIPSTITVGAATYLALVSATVKPLSLDRMKRADSYMTYQFGTGSNSNYSGFFETEGNLTIGGNSMSVKPIMGADYISSTKVGSEYVIIIAYPYISAQIGLVHYKSNSQVVYSLCSDPDRKGIYTEEKRCVMPPMINKDNYKIQDDMRTNSETNGTVVVFRSKQPFEIYSVFIAY